MQRGGMKYLCDKEMHAGKAKAIYKNLVSGKYISKCTCLYPKYHTGPTCKQKTYCYVIYHDKWQTTSHPNFLHDPIQHFQIAEDVCRELKNNTRAIYNPKRGHIVCPPILKLVKIALTHRVALTHRGFHKPCFIIKRNINKISNQPSNIFSINF
uniref:Wsv306-like protein n=1 Tax=Pasiphaea japonica whispovirus TaxID=2984286 RepID=A0A9C7CGD3_9VIRU|nr:MAG: wsv306-like protein [Pasiphaea japonica whispovirus]